VAEEMAKTTGGELYEYLVGNDFNGFMAKLMDSPVMFAKQATKQEYEEFEKTGKEPKS
jgi:hypothetical protein